MASVENRVVGMKFDNATFERGVSTTLSSLGKLKDSLGKMGGAVKGLGDFHISSKGTGLDAMGRGVDELVTKFSALQVAGVAAIANVANRAVNAGLEMAKSLTVSPISDGLGEYEKKIGTIQTILANTASAGTTLDQVSGALNDLNTYSDKTIYNFGEMAKNIGTFTAAGVDLKTATASIKGIANLAALSGSSSEQASTAMYQLSQAISAGRVSLQDWNSVVNANMGGSVFQRSLAETAVAMGKLPASALKLEGAMKNVKINGASFRDSISAKGGPSWLTSDVLTTALKNFTGDMKEADLVAQGFTKSQAAAIMAQATMASSAATKVKTASQLMDTLKESAGSGWAQTWELILGDFNEAPKLFTAISDTIGGMITRSADARNKVLADWKMDNGRHFLLLGLKNAFTALMSVIKPITQAFRDIFPATTGKQLADLSEKFMNFTHGLILGKENMENLRRTFRGVFAILGVVVSAVKSVISAFFGLFSGAQAGGGGILALTAFIGDLAYGLSRILTYTDPVGKFFDLFSVLVVTPIVAFVKVIANLATAIGLLVRGDVSGFTSKFNSAFAPLTGLIDGIKTKLNDFAASIADTFQSLSTFLGSMANRLAGSGNALGAGIVGGLASAATFLKNFFTDASGTISGVVDKFNSATDSGKGFLSGFGGSGLSNFRIIITAVSDKLSELRDKLDFSAHFAKFDGSARSTASGGVSALSNGLSIVMKIWDFMSSMLAGLGRFFGPFLSELGKFFSTVTAHIRNYIENMNMQDLLAIVNVATFGALYIAIAGFFKKMGGAANSAKGMFDNISGTFGALKDSLSALQSAVKASIVLQIGIAVAVLVGALFILAKIDAKALVIALGALAAVFGEIAAMMKIITKINPKSMVAAGLGMIAIATAVVILSGAIAILGRMPMGVLIQGGLAIAAIMAALAGFSAVLAYIPGILLTSVALVILSGALLMMAGVIALYAAIPIEIIKKGLTSMAVTLIALGIAMQAFGTGGRMVLQSVALTLLAKALVVLTAVLTVLGLLPLRVLIQGIIGMGAALLILAIAAEGMQSSIPGALAMLIMAAAVTALVPAIALLGSLPLEVIGKGLLAIAALMAIFVIGMYALTPVILIMALFSSSMLQLGLAILAAGVGFGIFVASLAALTVVGAAGFGVLAAGIITLLQLLPIMAQQFVYALVTIAKLLGASAPVLAKAGGDIVMAFVNEIARRIPELANAGYDMILGVLKAIRDHVVDITNTAIDIVTLFIGTIRDRLPQLIQTGVDFIISFVEGLAAAIRGEKDRTGQAGSDLAMAIIEGMVSGMTKFGDRVNIAIKKAAKDLVKSFKDFLGIHSPSTVFTSLGGDIIQGLINGIGNFIGNLVGKAREAGRAAITAIRGVLPDWANTGIDFITHAVSGVGKAASHLATKARETVTNAITAAKSMDASEIGHAIVTGMIKGISGGLSLVTNAAKNLAKGALDAAKGLLGIKSPSKEFEKIGKFVNQGFVNGLTDGKSATATATYNNMRDVLSAAMRAATEDIRQHEARLRQLTTAHVVNSAAVSKERAALAESRRELSLSSAAHRELTVAYLDEQRRITKLGDEYTSLTPKLEAAQKTLDDAIKTRDDYAKSSAAQYSKLNDITPESGVTEYVEGVRKKAEETKRFATLLQQLRDMGLNDTAYQELLAKGLDALPFVERLAALGIGSVNELNKVSSMLETEAKSLGDSASKALYQAGVDSAQGMVDGIKSKQSAIVHEMEVLATAMLAAIKRKLGIKSPSREFAKLGGFATQGMAEGLKAGVGEIKAASEYMADASIKSMQDNMARFSSGLSAELNLNPSVVPALDLSEMKNGAQSIEAVIGVPTINLDGAYSAFGDDSIYKSKLASMAEGLKAGIGAVTSASTRMIQASASSMLNAVTQFSSGLSSEMDVNPKIAPTLDLSEMKTGAKSIEIAIGTPTINLAGAYSAFGADSIYDAKLSAMAEGLRAGIGEITSASGQMIDVSTKSMLDAITQFSSGLSSEMNLSPTVSPSLDVTEMQNKLQDVESTFGRPTITFNGAFANFDTEASNYIARLSAMAEGLKAGVKKITSASDFVIEASTKSIRDTIARLSDGLSADMDLAPKIVPILDLTEMKKEAKNIGSAIGKQTIGLDGAYANANAASSSYTTRLSALADSSAPAVVEEKQFVFNQVNNSPKALSPAEIYRNTKNQLSVARGALV